MSRRYLALCTACDWHTGLLTDPAAGDRAFQAHTCTPRPPRPKKKTEKPQMQFTTAPPEPVQIRPAPQPAAQTRTEPPTWENARLDDLDPDMPWQSAALCAQIEPELWFPEKGGSAKSAKEICMRCPVRQPCLEEGLRAPDNFGIFGGLSERDRRKLRRDSGFDTRSATA